jgi:hypothetical protein
MNRIRASLAAVLAAAGVVGNAGQAFAGTVPNATTGVLIESSSSSPVDTGLTVNSQFSVVLSVIENHATYYAGGCGPYCAANADGGINFSNPCASDCLLPGAEVGALIYRIGNGSWMLAGSSATITSKTGGELYLAYNDDYFADNAGTYVVGLVRTK